MATVSVPAGIKQINHWIGGRVVGTKSGRFGPVYNPATGEVQAHVDFASAEEVDDVVACALKAYAESWRATPLSRRAECMFRLRELIDANRRNIAELITLEHGKTVADALGEVARGLENIEFACGIPQLLKGGYSEQASRGVDVYQIRQPLGVVAGDHTFQFSSDGADVDDGQRCRLREHVHSETIGKRSLCQPVARGIDAARRRTGWRIQRLARRSRGGGPPAQPS